MRVALPTARDDDGLCRQSNVDDRGVLHPVKIDGGIEYAVRTVSLGAHIWTILSSTRSRLRSGSFPSSDTPRRRGCWPSSLPQVGTQSLDVGTQAWRLDSKRARTPSSRTAPGTAVVPRHREVTSRCRAWAARPGPEWSRAVSSSGGFGTAGGSLLKRDAPVTGPPGGGRETRPATSRRRLFGWWRGRRLRSRTA